MANIEESSHLGKLHLSCSACPPSTYNCPHIEEWVTNNRDTGSLHDTLAGVTSDSIPVAVPVNLLSIAGVFAELIAIVALTPAKRGGAYNAFLLGPYQIGPFLGVFSQDEGRRVLRAIAGEYLLGQYLHGRVETVQLRCPSSLHRVQGQALLGRHAQTLRGRIAELWSMHLNRRCLSCLTYSVRATGDEDDLIPRVESGRIWPRMGSTLKWTGSMTDSMPNLKEL